MFIRLAGLLVAAMTLTTLSAPVTAATSSAVKNRAPIIRGTAPRTPTFPGQTYSFQPTAMDADGDKVTFVIANKPAWMTFDSRTGRLSGIPNAQNVGFYHDIEIAATDGKAVTALSAFMVYVKAAPKVAPAPAPIASPNVAINWQPPASNVDGSSITNLKGYVVHYGQTSKAYTNAIRIDNPSVMNYVIEGLPKGQYFFAVTSLNTAGDESAYSAEVATTVN